MKLKILGELPYFYQWDLNRKLIVEDGGVCSQVHFCNGSDKALVCQVKTEDGIRVACVPNILLQKAVPIQAYLYLESADGSRTRSAYRFNVVARSVPEEYVYSETETLNYAYLDKRLQDLEGEGLANAVAAYLKENPMGSGATAEEAAQIQKNREDIENLQTDKLDADKLPEAVNDALAQAKASGEFKGEPGKDGQPGQDGNDGYTPVKGVDYFDGIDGKDGKDGYTPVKGLDYFDGQPGQNGKDYILTDEDRNEIAGIAADMVEVPEGSGGGFDYVAGKSEGTKETIVLEGENIWHYGGISINNDIITPHESYMYTEKIKLNETKTFSFTGLNSSGVEVHIPIRCIVAYDVNGNRLPEHSVNTEIIGGKVADMPTRPITMHNFVDSVVLQVWKAFQYTKKTITLDGTDAEYAYCQFAPMRVVSSYDIPVLALNGDCYGMTKNVSKNLQFTFQGMSGVAEVKLQGSSSINTGKQIGGGFDNDVGGLYNFTIKFPEAFEAKEGWGAQTKYCFKANAIDHSHARNVCSCKLWGQIVKSRPNVPAELSSLPNGGAIDGFPIVISLNGKYYALGTLNIPKDGWMFGNPKAIVCADTHCDATKFKALATLDGDFELEYVEDEANADWVLTSLNTAIQTVMNSDGSDIDTTIGQYIDIPSAIDYYIHTVEESADDGTSKNYLLVTYDGTKWYFSAYDRDTTYGLYWTGETINYQKDGITFVRYAEVHKLMELIYNHKKADLKSRAVALRNNVKSEFNVANVFTKFVGGIPAAIYEQNTKRWPLLRSTSISNVEQILNWYRMRRAYIDKLIDAM